MTKLMSWMITSVINGHRDMGGNIGIGQNGIARQVVTGGENTSWCSETTKLIREEGN